MPVAASFCGRCSYFPPLSLSLIFNPSDGVRQNKLSLAFLQRPNDSGNTRMGFRDFACVLWRRCSFLDTYRKIDACFWVGRWAVFPWAFRETHVGALLFARRSPPHPRSSPPTNPERPALSFLSLPPPPRPHPHVAPTRRAGSPKQGRLVPRACWGASWTLCGDRMTVSKKVRLPLQRPRPHRPRHRPRHRRGRTGRLLDPTQVPSQAPLREKTALCGRSRECSLLLLLLLLPRRRRRRRLTRTMQSTSRLRDLRSTTAKNGRRCRETGRPK